MLEWLIIGGGIHGTHLSLVLTQQYGVSRDRVSILDPFERPLERWHQVTINTGMSFLRSPLVHHLHYDQRALGVFARIHDQAAYTRFMPTFSRPSLELFNRHTQYLIDKYALGEMRIIGRAERLIRLPNGWRIETPSGGIEARKVLLALGMSDQPHYPVWARPYPALISHIFDPAFLTNDLPAWSHLVIVGGGITAAQTALALAARQPGSVTVVMRHPVRVFDFDSDPCWMNALCLTDFHRLTDYDQRRAVIRAARHRGSLPPEVAAAFNEAAAKGVIAHRQTEITAAQTSASGILLNLADGTQLNADRVLLATGWEQRRPGGAWLDEAISSYNLPVARCAFPIIDPTLCWTKGLYVSGALAELEVGPAARNIIGARMTGQRMAFATKESS
jgi:thioredoxin reductase